MSSWSPGWAEGREGCRGGWEDVLVMDEVVVDDAAN